MNAQKGLVVLATLSLLGLSVACNDRYAQGVADGKAQGYQAAYDAGYTDGSKDGYAKAQAYFQSADYSKGLSDGYAQGKTDGYNSGYSDGKTDGLAAGYTNGYNVGYTDGSKDGYNTGYSDGSKDGYNTGYTDGSTDGYNTGYTDGHYDGTHGLSIGATEQLKGYANLLSMAHNDIFDYSKIQLPVSTSQGLVANGKLLLEESSLTNKDTLKRQAVVEQYLVVEMAKQVKGKFGLSDERSLKIAKAANHFRKYASNRALTADDTNAYATEIIGSDFKSIESAYSNTLKGDVSGFQSVMEKAAAKNGTSPEKMTEIVTQLFI
jgi:flagellar biosynthesis/type III secretory pathway protein FliH